MFAQNVPDVNVKKLCIMPAHAADYDRLNRFISARTTDGPPSTFQRSKKLPFQRWYHFKEAFSPELVVAIASSLGFPPQACLDPFGGSGTTAVTCQFLGIHPQTIEVNPFLCDVIEAKLSSYDIEELYDCLDFVSEQRRARRRRKLIGSFAGPKTLIEPGVSEKWVFDGEVANEIFALRDSIDALPSKKLVYQRLFKVLLGSFLVEYSNCYVNGKGRRYRQNWKTRKADPRQLYPTFIDAIDDAARDIRFHRWRGTVNYSLYHGDARELLKSIRQTDLAVFSPPYPNSFDYTDIYNIELWMLGYLRSWEENESLRKSTLRSHVQISHPKAASRVHESSPTLTKLLRFLESDDTSLWNRRIPEMLVGYFEDLMHVILAIRAILRPGGKIAIVVGDSAYAGKCLNVGRVLQELLSAQGVPVQSDALRKMRTSAQQGGTLRLHEHLVTVM